MKIYSKQTQKGATATRMNLSCHVKTASASWQFGKDASMKVIPCMDSAVQGNDFELIPTIRMERAHSVDGSFNRHFSSIYIVRELSPDEVGSRS